ncbi:hypothetical protein [Catellatospora methionotrophica]|uniref:hypothetical protein n=1 Tax=Catellatospora methionotrophica TaxID=121620 RepID=UPI00140851CE|nr:hypothetical protein [Catellatospora methionotrophica]
MQLDLSSIDWASLTHAYGSAEDVPDLIGALRSSDADVRGEAMTELYGNIFHQGSRYEASAYAVPFLLELVADSTTPDRQELIRLLASLAVGYGHHHAATGFPIAAMRDTMAQVPDQTWQSWSQAMKEWYDIVSTGQRQPIPLSKPERRALETRHELAAYDAVRASVPVLLDCLDDLDAEVAGEAIHALAWFPEEITSIRPRLLAITSDNQQPEQIAGAALVAVGLLGGTLTQPVSDLFDTHLRTTDPHLRWSAAVAWAHLALEDVPDTAVAELRGWAAIRGQDTGQTVWGARRGDLALTMLDRVARPVAEAVRAEHVAAVLAKQPTSNWHNHFNVVLNRAFPRMEPDHGRTFQELAPAQRAVVIWLTENPHVFGTSGPEGPLRQHGLPTTYAALRTYAELDE